MNKLFAVFKVVSATLVGLVGLAFLVLLALHLVMRETAPYQMMEWVFGFAVAAASILITVGCALLLHTGWREAGAEHSLRPLPNQNQTRFLVEIPSVKRYGLLDIQSNTVRGLVVGQNQGETLPLTPVSYDLERVTAARFPIPESHPAGNLMDEFFSS